MKRVLALVSCIAAVIAFSSGPAHAGGHSGPEALAKGDGEVSSTATQNQPITRQICDTSGFCYGEFPVVTRVTVTETEESFDFSARLGPKSSTLDPTSGAYGSMKLDYTSTVTTSVVADPTYHQFCNPGGFFYVPGGCPALSGPSTVTEQATATAEVTCLNVVQNRAAIGGHVVKFSGDFTPTRGLLFNATDNTIARQQVAPDEFLGTFVTDVPQTCPAPGADSPITSGDVYIKQS